MSQATSFWAMDMTMPMVPSGSFARFFQTLDAMKAAGFKFVSLTVASDYTSTKEAFKNIRLVRFLLLGRLGKVRFVRTVDEIRQAMQDGKLAVSLHFQGTVPIGQDLSLKSSKSLTLKCPKLQKGCSSGDTQSRQCRRF